MIIGEVGSLFSTTRKISYFSSETVLECDCLIIDLLELIKFTTNGHNAKDVYLNRKKQLEEFISFKRIPIIYFVPDPVRIAFNVPGRVEYVEFDFLVPIPSIVMGKEQGSVMHILTRTPFTEFFTKYIEYFRYTSFFVKTGGKTILETPHTKKCLAFYDERCVFLPKLQTTVKANESEFLEGLVKATRMSIDSAAISELPEWATKYFLPNERGLIDEIKTAENEIQKMNSIISGRQTALTQLAKRKKLFTSYGLELELEVKKLFVELGFETIEAEQNRDDLILKYKGRFAVVEIKGVSKTAAERHAAQLEKWSANFIEANDIIPKSILIVNTFKDIPLVNRENCSFPDQMIRYSTQREHCLITTIQLLNLYYTALDNPSSKDELIGTLFNTSGIYKGFEEWSLFMQKETE